MCKKIIVHSSLIEELIDSRKNLFKEYMDTQKEAGLSSISEITDEKIAASKSLRILKDESLRISKDGSLLERVFLSHNIDENYINAPDRNGDYHIIRYEVGYAPKYTYTNIHTKYLKKKNKYTIKIKCRSSKKR